MNFRKLERLLFPQKSLIKYENLASSLINKGIIESSSTIAHAIKTEEYIAHKISVYSEIACFYIHWTSRGASTTGTDELFKKSFHNIFVKLTNIPNDELLSFETSKQQPFAVYLMDLLQRREIGYCTVVSNIKVAGEECTYPEFIGSLAHELSQLILPHVNLDIYYEDELQNKFLRATLNHMFAGGFSRLDLGNS